MNYRRDCDHFVLDAIDYPIAVNQLLANVFFPENGKRLRFRVVSTIFFTTAAAYEVESAAINRAIASTSSTALVDHTTS